PTGSPEPERETTKDTAMAKKPKINFKEVLLQKGEYLALGVGGVGLLVLLIWGVSTAMGAKPPESTVKSLDGDAQRMQNAIKATAIPESEQEAIEKDLRLKE